MLEAKAVDKIKYTKPMLNHIGAISEITLGGSSGALEGANCSNQNAGNAHPVCSPTKQVRP